MARKRRRDGISYRTSDNSWYSSVTGTYKPLRDEQNNKIKGNTKESEKAAKRAYGRLLAQTPTRVISGDLTIYEVCRRYTDYLKSDCSKASCETAKHQLSNFCEFVGAETPWNAIRKSNLYDWAEHLKVTRGYNPTTLNAALQRVVSAFNYALKRDWITSNPVAKIEKPKPLIRVSVIDPLVERLFLKSAKDDDFADFFTFLLETGARPFSEAARITKKHLQQTPQGLQGVFTACEGHKTAKATGNDRIILLTDRAEAIVRKRLLRYPDGPIFRTKTGAKWTSNKHFVHLKRKLQKIHGKDLIPDHLCWYSCRHTRITRWLESGESLEMVAALAGNSPQVCHKHYNHISKSKSLWQSLRRSG